jgi:hypothetical protein
MDSKFFGDLTYKARSWAEIMQREVDRESSDLYATVLAAIEHEVPIIIIDNLRQATAGHAEYGRYQWMTTEIADQIKDNAEQLVIVDERTGKVRLRDSFEHILGSWEEYDAGVEQAREEMREERGISGKPTTPAQRAAYWKNKVWASAYWYPRTMGARRKAWGNEIAPWWIWLDAGNVGLAGAYPQNNGTNFVFIAQSEIQELFNATLGDKVIEAENLVSGATENLLGDPESFQPYDVLETFYEDGKKYKIYITKWGRVGTTLRVRRGR